MEFVLNMIFFVSVPCLVVYNSVKNIFERFRNPKKNAGDCITTPMNNTNKCFSTHDMQVKSFYFVTFLFLVYSKELHL